MKDLNNIFKSLNDLKDKRDSKKTKLKSEKLNLSLISELLDEETELEKRLGAGDLQYSNALIALDEALDMHTDSLNFGRGLLTQINESIEEVTELLGESPQEFNYLQTRVENMIETYEEISEILIEASSKLS